MFNVVSGWDVQHQNLEQRSWRANSWAIVVIGDWCIPTHIHSSCFNYVVGSIWYSGAIGVPLVTSIYLVCSFVNTFCLFTCWNIDSWYWCDLCFLLKHIFKIRLSSVQPFCVINLALFHRASWRWTPFRLIRYGDVLNTVCYTN